MCKALFRCSAPSLQGWPSGVLCTMACVPPCMCSLYLLNPTPLRSSPHLPPLSEDKVSIISSTTPFRCTSFSLCTIITLEKGVIRHRHWGMLTTWMVGQIWAQTRKSVQMFPWRKEEHRIESHIKTNSWINKFISYYHCYHHHRRHFTGMWIMGGLRR